MPYHHHGRLTDGDAAALAAYLKSIPSVAQPAPSNIGPSEKPAAPYLTVMMPQPVYGQGGSEAPDSRPQVRQGPQVQQGK